MTLGKKQGSVTHRPAVHGPSSGKAAEERRETRPAGAAAPAQTPGKWETEILVGVVDGASP